MKRGILVASDERGEWLLPWWWENYRRFNHLPVAFVDFGMSYSAKKFCEEKGELLPLELPRPCADKSTIAHADQWEQIYGKSLWEARQSWFKKPAAFNLTPFEKTLWLDLDCEVLESLDPLFDLKAPALSLETEAAIEKEGETLYNSGVVLYEKNDPLIALWAAKAFEGSESAWGDQQLLSRLIHSEEASITLLDERYNWRMARGLNIQAAIIHWVGDWGKQFIKLHGGLAKDLIPLR